MVRHNADAGVDFPANIHFQGKTIIPFSAHDGSGMVSSIRDIEKLCPNATVMDGLVIRYSDVQNAKQTVEQWLNELTKS